MNWYELGPFTVFDFETTGMSPVSDRVVELAALRIDLDGEESCYHSLVDPGRPIPPGVTAIHHITDEMVRGAPHFAAVGREFLEFAEGSTLVAHNARFDLGFLQEGLNRCGLPLWRGKTLDSVRLARRCFPGLASYRLQDLRAALVLDDEESASATTSARSWTSTWSGVPRSTCSTSGWKDRSAASTHPRSR